MKRKRTLKKLSSLLIVVMLLTLCQAAFAFASEIDESEPPVYVTTTTVSIGGQEVEVPMEVPIVTTRSASSVVTDTRKVYVPYTEEAIKDNAAVVNNIKRARGSSNSFTEKNGYIYFVSTINFSRDYYQSSYDYPRIDLISFQITREVITSAPFNGFRNANATAYQLGTRGPGGSFSVLDQKKYYSSIPYGTLQYVPSSWEPVLTVGTTYNRGVSYSIPMVYTTHTENLTYFHQVI